MVGEYNDTEIQKRMINLVCMLILMQNQRMWRKNVRVDDGGDKEEIKVGKKKPTKNGAWFGEFGGNIDLLMWVWLGNVSSGRVGNLTN